MKLQQLRFLCQVADSNFNVTTAAKALHTSQSGVSFQVRQLEEELAATIFLRQEKRLLGLTEVGKVLVTAARDVLQRADQMKTIVADFDESRPGALVVATTHVHARYALLPVIASFTAAHPNTALRLIQTFPDEIFQLLDSDGADVGLTTETAFDAHRFETVPAYEMGRCLITPPRHPLLRIMQPTLADVARHPLIVYDSRLSSGRTVMEALQASRIQPNMVISAVDVDVIKTYVGAGLGVAIVPSLAFEKQVDTKLRAVSMDHVFPRSLASVVTRRGKYLRRQARAFIELLAS